MFFEGSIDLPHIVAVTLVKVKVLQVLLTSMGSPDGSAAHLLGLGLKPLTIAKNPNITNCNDRLLETKKPKAQIRALYEAVHKLNPYFWPTLLNQMQMALILTYQLWHEALEAVGITEMATEGEL
ncbi:Zinc finger MYND-type [Penicillium cf. griseofulvum]|uniref:Zinc finger MYND-type n=1 Tax=Penicillium cf. griseofulvum TaxID=2972120 RepID=A0A9W9MZT4_9EURO|nr:Zinc finger MYND-type [Penicillium cf. griseofulvum]